MKKTLLSMLLLAVAAMTTVSCSNDDEQNESVSNKGTITFIAGNPDIEGETRTEFGPEFTPYWSVGDKIIVETDAFAWDEWEPDPITRFDFDIKDINGGYLKEATKTAKFIYSNASSINYNDFLSASNFIAYHGEGFYMFNSSYPVENSTISANLNEIQRPEYNKFDSQADLLLTRPIKVDGNIDYQNTPVYLKFKRIVGIIRLNLNAAKGHETLNEAPVKMVTLSTKKTGDNFSGKFTYKYNGELLEKDASGAKGIKAEIKGYKIGDSNGSIYLTSLPTTIAVGESFDIIVELLDGRTIKRTIAASEKTGDVVIPDGKITTFNISLEDPNGGSTPDPEQPSGAPTIEGNIITMNAVGHLTTEHINTALSANSSQLVIKGDINASDMNSVLTVLRKLATPIDLDLAEANIKADPNATYKGHNGSKEYFKKDNVLPDYLFAGGYKAGNCALSSIELPKSVTEIGQWILVGNPDLKKVVVQHKVNKIGDSMFDSNCTSLAELYILCPMSPDIFDTCIDGDNYGISLGITLYVNRDWENDGMTYEGPGGMWGASMMSEVILVDVDANGDIIQ